LNGDKYQKLLSLSERRDYNRRKQAEYRRRKKQIMDEGQKAGAVQAINEGLTNRQG